MLKVSFEWKPSVPGMVRQLLGHLTVVRFNTLMDILDPLHQWDRVRNAKNYAEFVLACEQMKQRIQVCKAELVPYINEFHAAEDRLKASNAQLQEKLSQVLHALDPEGENEDLDLENDAHDLHLAVLRHWEADRSRTERAVIKRLDKVCDVFGLNPNHVGKTDPDAMEFVTYLRMRRLALQNGVPEPPPLPSPPENSEGGGG